jgi:hypothetical protein
MNWNDPAARADLIEQVGPTEYHRLQAEQFDRETVATVNGHRIRPVQTRFGRLFFVSDTDRAFAELDEAKRYAEQAE